jgi:hypothetical protein
MIHSVMLLILVDMLSYLFLVLPSLYELLILSTMIFGHLLYSMFVDINTTCLFSMVALITCGLFAVP